MNAQPDPKSVPLEEMDKKLGPSPDGLTRVEAQKRHAVEDWLEAEREIRKDQAGSAKAALTPFRAP